MMAESGRNTREIVSLILEMYLPLVIVTGTVFNLLSMLYLRKKIHNVSLSMLFFALSVSDLVGMYSEPVLLLAHGTGENTVTQSVIVCEVFHVLYNFSIMCSNWIVVFVLFQLAARVCFSNCFNLKIRTVSILLLVTLTISAVTSSLFMTRENSFQAEHTLLRMRFGLTPLNQSQMLNKMKLPPTRCFNFGILNTLLMIFFPLVFTLACVIAHTQGFKAISVNTAPQVVVVRPNLSLHKDKLRLSILLGSSLIITMVPVAFFNNQILSEELTEETILTYTILSVPVHLNFALRPVYYLVVRKNFRTLHTLKASVISRCCCQNLTLFHRNDHDEQLMTGEELSRSEMGSCDQNGGTRVSVSEHSLTNSASVTLLSEC